ncbi:sigma-70 family RNA polymerase sigma factor [Neobacillus sp. D3-1R]|uniref:sigma-70 family RNA polymerase sigma factor n=1 Tax=Neobacillus sp. D3-1R TaxID=3445778 RepID=UPI003F9FF655
MVHNHVNEQAIFSGKNQEEVLENIMNSYGSAIKSLIYSYMKDWEITSDLTQEVLVTIYLKLDTFHHKSSLKTWIYSIAINKCKDYMKSWHYRNTVINEKLFFFMRDSKKTPEEQIIEKSNNKELEKAIWSLPLKYREVFLLYYYQDFSLEEVSEALGIPIATVKTRLYRGKEKVKKSFIPNDRGELHG